MRKKLILISGIALMMVFTSLTISVVADENETGILGTHLKAIGRNFHICEEDGGLYGRIIIGLDGFKPVFFEDIYIPDENIRAILMVNSFFVYCIYKE